MKKAVICLIAALLLCGCAATRKKTANSETVTFINGLKDADIWILPKTEENLKTTVWGKPTVSGIKADESRELPLCEAGDSGLYIIRMIDTGNILYSADGVMLESGWTVRITGDDLRSVVLEVTDGNGDIKDTYGVFAASL